MRCLGRPVVHTAVVVDRQLVRSVMTVECLVTDPRCRDTSSVVTAKQTRLAISLITVPLIRAVSTVLSAVTQLERQSAVEIVTLELTRATVTNRYTPQYYYNNNCYYYYNNNNNNYYYCYYYY